MFRRVSGCGKIHPSHGWGHRFNPCRAHHQIIDLMAFNAKIKLVRIPGFNSGQRIGCSLSPNVKRDASL